MKKTIVLLMALLMTFSVVLSGCGSKTEDPGPPPEDVIGSGSASDGSGTAYDGEMLEGAVQVSIGQGDGKTYTIIMMDNALIVFDMDQQRSIDPEKKVDEHIAKIKADIDAGKRFIQPAPVEETDFYRGYTDMVKKNGPMYSFPLYRATDACVGCGTCTKVCPMSCIHLEDRKPAYDYTDCANCMACIQACPTKAIQFVTVKEPNPNARYRNSHIALDEIIAANGQS